MGESTLFKMRHFLAGGLLVIPFLTGLALAQSNPGAAAEAPAYDLGVVLIQYDAAVYTAHRDALSNGQVTETDRPVGVVRDFLHAHGYPEAVVIERVDSLQIEVIDLGAEVDPHDVIDLLQARPLAGVLHAQPNFLYHPRQTSDAYATDQTSNPDPARPKAWHLKAIQLRDAWDVVWDRAPDMASGAAPITIGVIDTGVDFSNPDLAGKKWSVTACLDENGVATTCNGGRDFFGFTHDADPSPTGMHGTWVAGVAAGEFNNGYGSFGVTQDVEIVGIRVGDGYGPFSTLDIAQGVNFARHNQLDIINVSLSRSHRYLSCNQYSTTPAASAGLLLEYQTLKAYRDGLFVIAAGNQDEESGGMPRVALPADFAATVSLKGEKCWDGLDNVIQVGGTGLDAGNNTERTWQGTNYGSHIDIAAGARNIPTLNTTGDGTSYAAPQVAGVAALMLMVNPTLTASELKTKLRDSADILEAFDGLDADGNVDTTEKNLADGRRLNAYRAVKRALEEATTQLDPLPAIIANTDPFTSSAPLVFREQGLSEVGGWEITHNAPVAVGWIGVEDNDAISSLRIGAGYTVEVFRHSYFRGARQTYVGPQSVELSGHALDNQISSYKFYVTPASAVDEVLVFREQGLNAAGGWEIVHNEPVAVGWLWEDNDAISSLRIGAGYTVEVFRHSYFRGARQTYVGPQQVELSGHALDNQISSYKFYVTPAAASDEALVFREQGLNAAGGWEIVHNAPVEVGWLWEDNDAISSLSIGAGYTVEVFRHGYFRGTQQTYVGPTAVDLTGNTLDNQISSYKFYVTP